MSNAYILKGPLSGHCAPIIMYMSTFSHFRYAHVPGLWCIRLGAHAQARYTVVCVCVCVDCYSCWRINEVQVRVSSSFIINNYVFAPSPRHQHPRFFHIEKCLVYIFHCQDFRKRGAQRGAVHFEPEATPLNNDIIIT